VSTPEDESADGPGSVADLVHLTRDPAGEPEGALVLLHGRGVDERDLYPLLDELDPDRMLFGMTPGAPMTNLPPGGRHWYIVERIGYPHEETFLLSLEALTIFLDAQLRERGIPWERTVIGGFSQGAAVSCAVALGAGRPRAAGLLMMSGFYPRVDGWQMDPAAKRGMPAYVTHGVHDPVIPIDFGRQTRALLEEGGLRVTYREAEVPHAIDPALLPEIRQWVSAAIASEPVAEGPASGR
jgi:phospholipase/carboxylesterase